MFGGRSEEARICSLMQSEDPFVILLHWADLPVLIQDAMAALRIEGPVSESPSQVNPVPKGIRCPSEFFS